MSSDWYICYRMSCLAGKIFHSHNKILLSRDENKYYYYVNVNTIAYKNNAKKFNL